MESLIYDTILTTLTSALVGALVAAAITRARNSSNASHAMREGMRALLWRELKTMHSNAMKDGLDVDELRHAESVYCAYHGIGGNGTGTKLYEEIKESKVEL